MAAPTLDELRDLPEAAWLWDAARARIVWANPSGIRFFGGESLFDLLDRPFDAREPGVERITAIARTLNRGHSDSALLHFPSAGATAPIACRLMVHALPDGRPGLLVVAQHGEAEEAKQTAQDVAAAFDLLPSAAALVTRDGIFRHLNAAALTLLAAARRSSLGEALGDPAIAEELLERVEAAGLVAVVRPVAVRLGTRDVRITLRRLSPPHGEAASFAVVLMEDVTDRRALERQLTSGGSAAPAAPAAPAEEKDAAPAPPAPRKLPESDAAVFERLGKTLEEGIRQLPAAPAAPEQAPRRKLQRIPDQVRLPLENRGDAVLVAKDGQLLFANPAAARLFGYETGEDVINDAVLARHFGGLGQSLPPSDIPGGSGRQVRAGVQMTVIPWLGGPARQFVLNPAEAEPPPPADLRLVPAATGGTPARDSAAPSAEAGPEPAPAEPAPPPKASAEVIQLRPAASEADQELRAILDTAADGIITLDHDARIHTFSAGAEAIFGYRISDVAGKPFLDLLAPDSRKTVRDYLAALQGPGLASVFNDGREVTAAVRQGGTVPLFLTIGKLQAPRSQAAFCAVVRDITQWKKTEQELREAKERAEATSRQKSEFLASVSHELRTPLNAIMGFSEVMRLGRFGEIDNEKYRGYVQDIHASGAHLLSLINDLLDLSKVEAGKLELNFTAVNLGEVAEHAMKLLAERATDARVVLRKSFPADLPNVVADLRSMRQVMLNLLSNAIKFTDPGGQVVISAQLLASGELKLKVKDSGIGMDEDQLKSALEPFRRVATEGREVEGTGLGLPLTKALVEANRASFQLSSEPRRGTLAEITFPTTRVLAE
jgi:PAS domain S-box-containing protein